MANRGKKDPRIDLNTADADALSRIEGISEARARQLLAHRERHGPFRSWEEVEAVPGLGPVLVERLRAAALLGPASDGATALQVPAAVEPGDEEALDAVEVLSAVASLDLEAALAYEAGAEALAGLRDLRSHLLRFRDDHLRHMTALNRLLREFGARPIEPRATPEDYLLRRLARFARPFGPGALVLTLLSDEQMTNGTYELALGLDWDDDVRGLLERHASDEQRHLLWLSDQEDLLFRTAETVDISLS
ncbi:MAG TPA: helix-hairpin-helix domain-containing protein [Myxococcus sp.]|jgi:competence ComEA-like helix-hairpin-helix protein|nr:helix-hairpin-helix domain-containing protein [Myxococcus sp.]